MDCGAVGWPNKVHLWAVVDMGMNFYMSDCQLLKEKLAVRC
jgi:hypothetical protein